MTTSAILGRPDLTAMQRIVLAVLHSHADNSGRIEMSQSEIASHAATAARVVRKSLAVLERVGALRIERRGSSVLHPQIVRLKG